MSSQARSSREEERRLSVLTLAIASLASATAAIVTSLFWTSGTPIAAAVTPVLVALVSEMLHRPATRVVERFTTETDALPEAAGAGPPPREQAVRPEPVRDAPGQGPTSRPGMANADRGSVHDDGVRVYRAARPPRRLRWRPIAVTGALAFVIGATVLTLPELIGGGSLAGDGRTTLGGGGSRDGKAADDADRDDDADRERAPQRDDRREPTGDGAERPAPERGGERAPAPSEPDARQPPEEEPAPEDEPAPEEEPAPEPTSPTEPPVETPVP